MNATPSRIPPATRSQARRGAPQPNPPRKLASHSAKPSVQSSARNLAATTSTTLTQSLKGEQKLILQPKIIASLKLLALPLSDIKEQIHHELDSNPFLEQQNDETDPTSQEADRHHDAPISIEASLEDTLITEQKQYSATYDETSTPLPQPDLASSSYTARSLSAGSKSLATIIEETAAQTTSLEEELLLQLALAYECATPHYQLGQILISMIDSDGFLTPAHIQTLKEDLEHHHKHLPDLSPKLFSEVIKTLQSFAPAGIAATNTQEALLIQLQRLLPAATALEKKTIILAQTLIKDHFTLVTKRHLENLAKTLAVPRKVIDKAIHQISLLEPKPARNYTPLNNLYVEADATIEVKNGSPTLTLHNDYLKNLRISPQYTTYWKKLQQHPSPEPIDPTFQTYLNDHKRQAEDFLSNLTFRTSNLEKILLRLIEVQIDVFVKGLSHLKPYSLSELAAELNMDKGIVSRLVNLKYVATQWGLIPLRQFFSSTKIQVIPSKTGAPTTASAKKIETLIQEIIATYPEKRLSDQKVTDMLKLRGYQIARRTVTKYRQRMNILSSFDRTK